MLDQELIRLVDAGAMGGLQEKWGQIAHRLWPVLFEPNHEEITRLSASLANFPKATVVEKALSNVDANATLFVTRNPTCVSLLEPNDRLLANYGIRVHFEVVRREVVECARYDSLHHAGVVPAPDVIKIDVQGHEFEVLLGFGGLLKDCMAVQLEAHLYPLYREQKVLGDLVALLASFGMVLRHIEQDKMGHFGGDVVEVDAYFTRNCETVRRYDEARLEKFHAICKTLGLPAYRL
jgi:FkbM family methyltransferase